MQIIFPHGAVEIGVQIIDTIAILSAIVRGFRSIEKKVSEAIDKRAMHAAAEAIKPLNSKLDALLHDFNEHRAEDRENFAKAFNANQGEARA